jgi:hypothetical protein
MSELRDLAPPAKIAFGLLLGVALETTIGDELAQKQTKEYLRAIGRPQIPAEQNALLTLMKAENLPNTNDATVSEQGFDANQGIIQAAFDACKKLRRGLDEELASLTDAKKAYYKDLCKDMVAALQPLVKGSPGAERALASLASSGAIGGALYLLWKSTEQAFKIRPTATMIMWAVEIMALLLSATGTLRQFWDAFIMRIGISTATYILAIVQLFVVVNEDSKGVKAAVIIPNLLILFVHFVYPRAYAYWKDHNFQDQIKRYGPANAIDGDGGTAITEFVNPIIAALETFSATSNDTLKVHPADNKTVANVTTTRTISERLSEGLRRDLAMPPAKTSWNLILKAPSITYGEIVGWAQFFSSLGNTKVLADNVPFLVLINLLVVDGTLNKAHSPDHFAKTVVRYSGAMFFSLFTYSRFTLDPKKGAKYFDENPEFARDMAFTTTALMLSVAKHLPATFGLLVKGVDWLAHCFKRDTTTPEDIALREDQGPRVVELQTVDDYPPVEKKDMDELLKDAKARWRAEVKQNLTGDTVSEDRPATGWITFLGTAGALLNWDTNHLDAFGPMI